jgi:hypothetical protein
MNNFTALACINLRPTAGVSVDDAGIHWYEIDPDDIPSDQEIAAEVARLESEYAAKEYQRKRVNEYPLIGDQLDALWKGGTAADEMKATIMAVKAKYPKPE